MFRKQTTALVEEVTVMQHSDSIDEDHLVGIDAKIPGGKDSFDTKELKSSVH